MNSRPFFRLKNQLSHYRLKLKITVEIDVGEIQDDLQRKAMLWGNGGEMTEWCPYRDRGNGRRESIGTTSSVEVH